MPDASGPRPASGPPPAVRRLLAAALLAVLPAVWAAPARAGAAAGPGGTPARPPAPGANPDYKLTVSAGLAGYCRVGWLPVHVAVDAGRDFDGEIAAALRTGPRGTVLHETRWPVQLPAGSKKDYHLYLRHESPHVDVSHGVEVALVRGRRPVDGTVQFCPLNLVKQSDYLVCVVSDQPRVLRALVGSGQVPKVDDKPLPGEDGVTREFFVAAPALRQLPDRAAGYNGVDFLVLCQTPLDSAELGPERLAAIADYARDGGVVVLAAGDRDWFARPELRPLVGVRRVWPAPAAEAQALASRLAGRYGSFGPRPAAMNVHGFDLQGCVPRDAWGFWTGSCGLGTVLVWRLDPAAGAVSGWPGLYHNWAEMALNLHGRPRQDYGMGFGPSEDQNPVSLARRRVEKLNLSREKGAPVLLVVFLVVLYLVLVGPINYFVLRRLDMRALSIATVPLLSAIFVLLTFALGYITRGVTTVGRRLSVAAAYSGSSRAQCLTSQSVFPAGSMLVEIGTQGRGLACPLTGGVLGGGQQQPAFATQDDAGYFLKRHPMSMWRMEHFEAVSPLRLGGPVTLESAPGGTADAPRFRLQNASAVGLREVFVHHTRGPRYAWVGELPANMKRPHEGELAPWRHTGDGAGSPVAGIAPSMAVEGALELWFRGELGAGRNVFSRGSREVPSAVQLRDVLLADPRLGARQRGARQGQIGGIPRLRLSNRNLLVMFAMAGEEFEPLRLDGRPLRRDRPEDARDVLVILAEEGDGG